MIDAITFCNTKAKRSEPGLTIVIGIEGADNVTIEFVSDKQKSKDKK